MLTIAVLNQKGGVGKSTLSTNLAAAAHLRKRRVLLVDLKDVGQDAVVVVRHHRFQNRIFTADQGIERVDRQLRRLRQLACRQRLDPALCQQMLGCLDDLLLTPGLAFFPNTGGRFARDVRLHGHATRAPMAATICGHGPIWASLNDRSR